ncbi:MAG: hypothetical protein WD894_03740 [Pirellulales bacterium]
MPRHSVDFTVPARPIAHSDIIFTVEQDDERFGELRVSKGNVVWTPANKKYGFRLTWKQLSAIAQERGKQIRVGL